MAKIIPETDMIFKISEKWEVVSIYEMYIDGIEQNPLKIKVLKMHNSDFPCYRGIANLEVKGGTCAGYYGDLHSYPTAEAALNGAVDGFFAFLSDEAEIQEVEDW